MGGILNLKEIVGFEGALVGYANANAFQDAFSKKDIKCLNDFELALNFEVTGSAGLSVEADGEFFIKGVNGTVRDQSGISPPFSNGVPINAGACVPTFVTCVKANPIIDFKQETFNAMTYQFGFGEGFDLSVDLLTISVNIVTIRPFDNTIQWFTWSDFENEVWKDISEYLLGE